MGEEREAMHVMTMRANRLYVTVPLPAEYELHIYSRFLYFLLLLLIIVLIFIIILFLHPFCWWLSMSMTKYNQSTKRGWSSDMLHYCRLHTSEICNSLGWRS